MARGEKKKSVDIINGSSKGLWPSDWNAVVCAGITVCIAGYHGRASESA